MSTNVLLQLYKDGWREQTAPVIDDNLRIEGLLGTGSLEQAEARRVAIGQLDLYASPIESNTVAVEPAGIADTPWISHVPGQSVLLGAEDQLVESLTFTRDQDGHVDYVAELGTHHDTPEERSALATKKMSNGTLGGTSRVAQPIDQTPAPAILTPLPPTCCTWGFTGRGSGVIAASDAEGILIAAPQAAAGGDLFIPPDEDLLPAGLWSIQGTIIVSFAAAVTGEVAVEAVPPDAGDGDDPAAAGGRLEGLGYVDGADRLVFRYGGVLLLDIPWTIQIVVTNSTGQTATVTATMEGFGQQCTCELATTAGGG